MARKPIAVSLPEQLVKKTARFCKKHALTVSEFTGDALRDYLYKQELWDARKGFTLHLQKRGIGSREELIQAIRS